MTDKQRRFCKEYIIDCNSTQAAIRAGYSKKTAYSIGNSLLKKHYINTEISKLMNDLEDKTIASAEEILQYLTSVMRGELKEDILKFKGKGVQEIVSVEISAKDRLKAAELLAKRHGIFKDNVAVEGSIPVMIIGSDSIES